MSNEYKADPALWDAAERFGRNTMDMVNCLLELRARVEALEATQHTHPEQPDADPAAPAPASTLVERVACICADFASTAKAGQSAKPVARAAIREVAAWLEEHYGGPTASSTALEQEAER